MNQKEHLARIRTVEVCRKGGRRGGRNNVLSGHISRLGKKNVESGHLAAITTPETCSKGGQVGTCVRWNLRRGKACRCGKHRGQDLEKF